MHKTVVAFDVVQDCHGLAERRVVAEAPEFLALMRPGGRSGMSFKRQIEQLHHDADLADVPAHLGGVNDFEPIDTVSTRK